MKKIAIIISCEHAVDSIPEEYSSLFTSYKELLASHRGIDFGALTLAQTLRQKIPCDFFQATCTRLLIDCNRESKYFRCFSEVTQNLSVAEKKRIIREYYLPYRQAVMACIKQHIQAGLQVWHLSIHSFTPELNGIVRNADLGFLYDPKRPLEKALAQQWKQGIKQLRPEYRIRMNYPYSGISDGFTRTMRKYYPNEHYLGLEVEANQGLTVVADELNEMKHILTDSLLKIIC